MRTDAGNGVVVGVLVGAGVDVVEGVYVIVGVSDGGRVFVTVGDEVGDAVADGVTVTVAVLVLVSVAVGAEVESHAAAKNAIIKTKKIMVWRFAINLTLSRKKSANDTTGRPCNCSA